MERYVDQRSEMLTGRISLHDIRNNSHNRPPLAWSVSLHCAKALAQRFLTGKKTGSKALIHNCNRHPRHLVGAVKIPAGYSRCFQHSEIIRTGSQNLNGISAIQWIRPPLYLKTPQISEADWNRCGDRRCFYTWNCLQLRFELVEVLKPACGPLVFLGGQSDRCDQYVLRITYSGWAVHNLQEAVYQYAGSGEQHHRQRHLSTDQ